MIDRIYKAASATPGVSKPGKRYINRSTWFWNDDVGIKVHEKKRLYHKFLEDKTPVIWQIYKNANREAKKAVAFTRADHYKKLYGKLDIRDGEKQDLTTSPLSSEKRRAGTLHCGSVKVEHHLTGKKVPLYGKRKVVQQNVQINYESSRICQELWNY